VYPRQVYIVENKEAEKKHTSENLYYKNVRKGNEKGDSERMAFYCEVAAVNHLLRG